MTRYPNRRQVLAGAGLAFGGGILYAPRRVLASRHLADQQLRTVGLAVTVQERILDDFQARSGVGSVSGRTDVYPNTQRELLSGFRGYDCWETNGERLTAVAETGTIKPIPVSGLSNWRDIRDTFTRTDPRMAARAQISGQIWADNSRSSLWMVPTVFNFDSIGYRPDLVDAEEANTWTSIFDRKFRGRTGLNVDPLVAFGQAILAMNSLGMLAVPNPGNPTRREIDEASKFLISKKKEGQFLALWGDFDELVDLFVSGNVILADAWQPTVLAVKAQGIPCSYAVPKEGYRGWAIGICMMNGTPNEDAVLAYADYWLSGPPAIAVAEQGYYSPTTTVEKIMPKEKYGYWYEGRPWKGAPERGIREGDLRDGGSLVERAAHVRYWHQWPDEYHHLIMRWDEFRNA